MTLDELKALNPGRDDLEIEVVCDVEVIKYRGEPPIMVAHADGEAFAHVVRRANRAEARLARVAEWLTREQTGEVSDSEALKRIRGVF